MPDPTHNPVHIYRADIITALESLAITDVASVAEVVITPASVDITRYVRGRTGGIHYDPVAATATTETTRIEIR